MNKKYKKFWRLFGGISGLLVGGWIIFYKKDLRGFLIAIISALWLILKKD